METLIYVSLVLNVCVLIPIVILMAIKSPIVDQTWGGYTAARGILMSIYLSILVVSVLLLFKPAPAFVAALLLAPLSKKFAGKALRLWGAYLSLALFIAVYPANINMAIEWSSRDLMEQLFAYARLPFQFFFLWATWKLIKVMKARIV